MTSNLFFSEKQLRLVTHIKWLIAFCFLLRLVLFFTPFIAAELAESPTFNNINFVLLTAAVWGSYFLVRKKWFAFILIGLLAFAELMLKKDIKISLDYYMSYVFDKNTETINLWVNRFFIISYFILIPLLYGKAEGIKGKKQWLLTFLVGIATIVTMDNANLGILERINITGNWQEVLYSFILAVLYTIKDVAFLLAFLHLINRVKNNQHLLRLPEAINMVRKQFLPSFFVSYSVFIFSTLTLVYSIIKMSFSFIFDFNWFVLLEGACIALPVLVSASFIGNTIERRSNTLGNYYGFFGFISWVPIINIVGYLTIAFVEAKNWIKAKAHEYFGKQRLIHIIASCLFILALYIWLYKDKKFTDALYFIFLYSIVTFVLAHYKRVILMAILASLAYIINDIWDMSKYYDDSMWKLMGEKFDWETLFLVIFYSVIHYSIFFIVHKSLYRETSLADSFPNETVIE